MFFFSFFRFKCIFGLPLILLKNLKIKCRRILCAFPHPFVQTGSWPVLKREILSHQQSRRSFAISGLPLSYFLARTEVLSCNSSNNLKCLSRRIRIEVFEELTQSVEPVWCSFSNNYFATLLSSDCLFREWLLWLFSLYELLNWRVWGRNLKHWSSSLLCCFICDLKVLQTNFTWVYKTFNLFLYQNYLPKW